MRQATHPACHIPGAAQSQLLTLHLPDPESKRLLKVCALGPHWFPPSPALSASLCLRTFSKAGAGCSVQAQSCLSLDHEIAPLLILAFTGLCVLHLFPELPRGVGCSCPPFLGCLLSAVSLPSPFPLGVLFSSYVNCFHWNLHLISTSAEPKQRQRKFRCLMIPSWWV